MGSVLMRRRVALQLGPSWHLGAFDGQKEDIAPSPELSKLSRGRFRQEVGDRLGGGEGLTLDEEDRKRGLPSGDLSLAYEMVPTANEPHAASKPRASVSHRHSTRGPISKT
jgi:hypothetical protein